MKFNLFILFFLLFFFQISTSAQVKKADTIVFSKTTISGEENKDFSFVYSENDSLNFSLSNYRDEAWKNYELDENNDVTDGQTLWLRSHFKIDSSLVSVPLNIKIFQLGACDIFLDGKKIGSVGKISEGKVNTYSFRNLEPLTFSLGDTKPHVLAIRFFPIPSEKMNTFVKFSSKSLNASLVTSEDFYREKIEETENIHLLTMLISGFFLALSFIHFLLFGFYRKAVYNLYFALYNLSISFLTYMVLESYKLDDPLSISSTAIKVLAGLAVFTISLSGFINTLFSKKRRRFTILVICAILGLAAYYFSPSLSAAIIFSLLFFVVVESIIVIVKAMIRREKAAFIVGGGILTFLAFIIITVLASFFKFIGYTTDNSILLLVVLISFPLSISAYLAWQFATTNVSLKKQVDEVQRLSEINLQQEQEKQHILQNQNDLLEKQVEERTQELKAEKQKSEDLLLNILPHEVAEELKYKGKSEAKYYDEVSVLFTDFVSFTQNSAKIGAERMLHELNECFTAFDFIMEKHGLEKIKTIGDAYMAVCGLPNNDPEHAYKTVLAAIDIIEFIEKRKKENPDTLDIRIGINSGSIIAGIVGVKKFAYDIWGDTVNTAARMEQCSEKGKINISDSTYQLVKDKAQCEYRGKVDAKGKGGIEMYFVSENKKL